MIDIRILLDMDGVIADFTGAQIEQYNHLTCSDVKRRDITNPKGHKCVKHSNIWLRIKDSPGFIRGLQPISGAIEGVSCLHNAGHEIVFVSNGTNCPSSGHEKRDWLKYYFVNLWKYAPLVLTYHKHFVRGDVLLDDNPHNLEGLHKDTVGLLYHQPYNELEDRFELIYDWSHFLQWVSDNG